MPGVGFVGVHYYEPYLERSLASLARLARQVDTRAMVLVPNRPTLGPLLAQRAAALRLDAVEVVPHDNSGLEFGAYQAGLGRLSHLDLDWIVFVNDTFCIHSCFSSVYRKHLLLALRRGADMSKPQAAGEVVGMPRSYALGGRRLFRWLTTSVFALNGAALEAIGRRIYCPEIDRLVHGEGRSDEFFSSALDPALAHNLGAWLFSASRGSSWYASEALTDDNASRFAAKARAILQERHLAARLDEVGTWFFELKPSGVSERISHRLQRAVFRPENADPLH